MDDPTTADLEARVEELERRLRRSDPRASMETAFWAVMHNILPDETRRHVKAATREQLLAARTYLDHWIERMDEKAAAAPAPMEKIEIE
jgi:hypothetical protein